MNKIVMFVLLVLCFFNSEKSISQSGDLYVTSGLEFIFSKGGTDNDGPVRWSPVFNIQFNLNKDINNLLGVYTGLAIRNIGFIWDDPNNTDVRYKFRSYNLGIPVGLKIGNRNGLMLFGGYEFELPIHYKEKMFVDEKKEKFTILFSDRVNPIQHSVFAGIQLFSGTTIKFKYYLSDFHNKTYTDSTGAQPYANLNSNIFYVSLNFNLFKNAEFYYKEVDKNVSTARL